jgi:Uma2 family endonuclease
MTTRVRLTYEDDIVYTETARLSVVSNRGIEGPPTLAVEIVSPSTTGIDRRRKLQLYARYAVPSYWIIDPLAKTIEAYRLTRGAYREAGTLSGTSAVSLPPFADLMLEPREIGPTL